MALVSQRQYAKRRGISQAAVWKRTTAAGGPIPTHTIRKLIDPDETDALWDTTMSPQGVGNVTAAAAEDPSRQATGRQPAQARAAVPVVDVQTKRLALEQRRGALISRDRATLKTYAFARTFRDTMLAWPLHVGPQLAATFDRDAGAMTAALEEHVRQPVETLASERVDFDTRPG